MSLSSIRRRLIFYVERQFIKGPQYQLLFVGLFIGLISLLGGIMLWPVAEADESFGDAVWWAFLRLSDPGYLGDDQGVWRRILSTFFTVAGYVIFLGSLVAIITSWLNRKLRLLEQGLSPVSLKNHIVILGWTNRTLPIAAELFLSEGRVSRFLLSRGSRRLRLVILAEEVGPEFVQQIKDHPFLKNELKDIILRSGQSIDYEHLRRVNAREASAIVVPADMDASQELLSPDVRTIKALLTLQEQTADLPMEQRPYIVAEIQEESKRAAAKKAYEGPMKIISSDATIGQLTAQILRHPQLSKVYHQLLSQNESSNIFVRSISPQKGETLGSWRKAATKTIVMGGVRPTENGFQPFLNAADETELLEGDRLVLLARSAKDVSDFPHELTASAAGHTKVSVSDPPASTSRREIQLLILGWNAYIPQLLKSLSTHRSLSYTIQIVAMRPLKKKLMEMERNLPGTPPLKLKHTQADYTRSVEMERLHPERYDKILLAGTARLSSEEEMDARTLVGLAMLTQLMERYEHRPQILVQLADPANVPLLGRFEVDRILSPLVLSHLMAQVALRPELHSIYQELFSMTGAEITLQRPNSYDLAMGTHSYSQLSKKVAKQACTLLGVLPAPARRPRTHPFWIPRSPSDSIRIDAKTQLVVLQSVSG
jgi:hypothetical protein